MLRNLLVIMVRVKICGITNLDDGLLAAELGASALGFVFAASPRQIDANKAKASIDGLPPFISKVGIFADEDREKVRETAAFCGLDVLQFHGSEEPSYCQGFSRKVIKAFRVKDLNSLNSLSSYKVSAYLLDSYTEDVCGGTGKTFNWQIAKEAKKAGKPIILSGGLNPANVAEAIEEVCPYAVDVSSGVEKEAGKKDPEKLKKFMEEVKTACSL